MRSNLLRYVERGKFGTAVAMLIPPIIRRSHILEIDSVADRNGYGIYSNLLFRGRGRVKP